MFLSKFSVALLACALLLLIRTEIKAAQIVVTTTIQEAVNQANPGDTVFVPPSIYRENVVIVKDNLTIRGSRGAVLDGTGLAGTSGIRVVPAVAGTRINGFKLDGLTIRNYSRNGIFLSRVDNFTISGGVYEDNEEYGIFPVRSSNGLIEGNQVSGAEDTGIYIGQSDQIVVRKNNCFNNTSGIEIENATHIGASENLVRRNSIGIAAFVLPLLSIPVTEFVSIENNIIIDNNRPNTIDDPDEILSRLPDGVGILIVAADNVVARNNRVLNNDTSGIALFQLPPDLASLDPRVNPFPDNDIFVDNIVLHNATMPDQRIPLPAADLNWDLSGTGNHWMNNQYQTSFPSLLP
jgi:parallel beta-helix repeat protein